MAELVRVAGRRWTIAECLEEAGREVQLDQYELRKRVGWYRRSKEAMPARAHLKYSNIQRRDRHKKAPPSPR